MLTAAVLVFSTSCATIFSGTSQTVHINTIPEGHTVYFDNVAVEDGQVVNVRKRMKTPEVNIGTPERPYFVEMDYSPDPWLIGDGLLIIVGVIPGLIAFGVDFGTGAWRKLEQQQRFYVNRDRDRIEVRP